MSFPVPIRYNLTDAKNETVVVYNNGREKNLLPWIDGSGSGGGESGDNVQRKDVNFFDSDGTLLYSYTTEEFATLAEMPKNPSHAGLVAQGWNWSLDDAKAKVVASGSLNVGQMYVTDDGTTRIYIHLDEERKSPMLGVCPNGTVDVDWGDGTEHDTLSGSSLTTIIWTPTHNYSSGGDYVIKLTVAGSMAIVGENYSNNFCKLLRYSSGASAINMHYLGAIMKVEIGANTLIGGDAFSHCYNLTVIVIPDSVTRFDIDSFRDCYSLTNLVIPNSVTNIGNNSFSGCYALTSIILPNSVTNIGSESFNSCFTLTNLVIPDSVNNIGFSTFASCYNITNIKIPSGVALIRNSAFSSCYSLTSITVPSSVTSIGNGAFANCYGIKEYHFLPIAPPTLNNTNAFSGIADDCVIFVPVGSLEAYQTASNWSTYASHMQEETS